MNDLSYIKDSTLYSIAGAIRTKTNQPDTKKYKPKEMAEAICPDYYNKLKELMDENERLYFYYCSKLGADDLCSDYENRPDICKDFPLTALKILPDTCGYLPWRESVNKLAMSIKAREDLIAFYKSRIG